MSFLLKVIRLILQLLHIFIYSDLFASDYVIAFLLSKRSEWHLRNLHFCHGLRLLDDWNRRRHRTFISALDDSHLYYTPTHLNLREIYLSGRKNSLRFVSFVFGFCEFSVDVLYGHYLNCKSIFFGNVAWENETVLFWEGQKDKREIFDVI